MPYKDPNYRKNYYLKNRIRILVDSKKWRDDNKEWKKQTDKKYRECNKEILKKWRDDNKECLYQKKKEKRFENKIRVYNHYSNYDIKCSCCGENQIEFLSIDHIEGGGNKHRKALGFSGYHIYNYLIKNNFPPGFQILCMNCNFSKGKRDGNGICIHQKGQAEAILAKTF